MVDIVDRKTRSRMMAGIKGTDTKPELLVRKGLFKLGFRYRLHDKNLRGKPDIVFARLKAVIFVHGCFWHGHNCPLFKLPATRTDWWKGKIEQNRARDMRAQNELAALGWRQAVVWECALKGKHRRNPDEVIKELAMWLNGHERTYEARGSAI
ncbi:MAG: very short patch repair endonuclease [Pseudomonadota bacterium]|nr:very short patch repair endonuclease [Pseudomonadota bacterium]